MSAEFKKKIKDKIKDDTPSKEYLLSNGSGSLVISNNSDKDNFKKLFGETAGQGTGFGEIALFWLFGGTLTPPTAISTQGENNPDLKIGGVSAEVKSYSKGLDNTFILGRFQSQTSFREMVSIIFGISNLSSSGVLKNSKTGTQQFIDVLNFNYKDLVTAAEKFCDLRSALYSLKKDKIGQKAFDLLPFLNNLESSFDQFDQIAKRNNLSAICGVGVSKPGGEKIGQELTKFVLKNLIGTKPGDKGYFINVTNNGDSITYIQVDLEKINDRKVTQLEKGFNANGGKISINLKQLFGPN
jgi:hypothetical protein